MQIHQLRKEIDRIDKSMILALSKRAQIAKKIGKIKKKKDIPIIDKSREREIKINLKKLAKKHHLDEDYVLSVFRIIIWKSKKDQK